LDLGQALEFDQPEGITVKAPDTDALVAERMASLVSPDEIYRTAVAIKPALRSGELQIAAAREGLASARAAYFPTLSFGAGYSNGYFRNLGKEYAALNTSFADQWKTNGSYSVGLSLNIPIFNAMQTQDRVRNSRLQVRASELRLTEEKKTLYKEIRQAYSNAVAADKAISAARNSTAATLRAYEYARDSFEAGRLSAYEYAEAKTKYALSQVEEIRAKYDFIYKAKVLDFYRGIDF
ncbi:TolC family protein, partial [Porphyromonas loveana]